MSGRSAARGSGLACAFSALAGALVFSGMLASGAAFAQAGADAGRGAARAAACAGCHGAQGRAPLPDTPSLAGQPPAFLVLQMVLFREGLREAPAMKDVLNRHSDRDLADLAAYFSRLEPEPAAVRRNPALQARGAELARAMGCGSCHGAGYAGRQQMPRLAGQREDYLVAAMKAYRDNRRTGSDTSMNGILYQVPDADIAALAHYLAQL